MMPPLTNSKLIVLVLTFFLTLAAECAAQNISQGSGCTVNGSVLDLSDAVVPGAIIQLTSIASGNSVGSSETDIEGRYAIRLVSGIYEVLFRSGFNYWNSKRARVSISCDKPPRLNFYVLPECVSYGCQRRGFDFVFLARPRYDKNLVIAYNFKKKSKGKVVYHDALLTYGTYTVYGKEIVQDLKTRATSAKGPGWIEDGYGRKTLDQIDISFASELLNDTSTLHNQRQAEHPSPTKTQ